MRTYLSVFWLTLLILVLAGCYPETGAGPQQATPRPVDVIELRAEPVVESVTLIGRIEPWQEAILYFEVTGVVAEVFVEEGKAVAPGDPIARLVPDDYTLALSKAEADLEAAEAAWSLLKAGTREEDKEAARADHARAMVRAAYWTDELRRTSKLAQTDTVATAELERVRQEQEAADQEKRATAARLQRAIAGPRKQQIEAAAAEVGARTQAVALARRQLEKATLRAPFGGRVEKRLLDVGAYINVFPTGGVPVVQLVDLDQADAVVDVPEALLSRFAGKRQVEIVSAVDPKIRASGRIISLGEVADPASGTYELRARISNPQRGFTGAMVVLAKTTAQTPRHAIYLPVTAIRRAYGQAPRVLLVEPKSSRVVAREVKLGPITENRIEISAGVSDGELLIVRGQDRVVVGDQVKHRLAPPTLVSQMRRELP